jgi:hypothetical protein
VKGVAEEIEELRENLAKCQFIHQKSHNYMTWVGNTVAAGTETNRLIYNMAHNQH